MSLETDLAEAQVAYHKLMTGKMARVIVDSNGERVEFTAANADKLAKYIADLKQQIGTSSYRPLTPYF